MPTITCPGCSAYGDGGRNESAFQYISRDGLLELRRCRACGAGLLVRFTVLPTHAYAELVDPEVWEQVELGQARTPPAQAGS